MFDKHVINAEYILAPTTIIVPNTNELIGYNVYIKLKYIRPKLPKLPIPNTIIITIYRGYELIYRSQIIPNIVKPIIEKKVINLNEKSFKNDEPFFDDTLSTK